MRYETQARLLPSTQANMRFYKSVDGRRAEQLTEGYVAEAALAVVLAGPLEPQAASRYYQAQHWHPRATLLLADWTHAGRTDLGEKFAFTAFSTELRVRVADRLTGPDCLALRPAGHLLTSQAGRRAVPFGAVHVLSGPPEGV